MNIPDASEGPQAIEEAFCMALMIFPPPSHALDGYVKIIDEGKDLLRE